MNEEPEEERKTGAQGEPAGEDREDRRETSGAEASAAPPLEAAEAPMEPERPMKRNELRAAEQARRRPSHWWRMGVICVVSGIVLMNGWIWLGSPLNSRHRPIRITVAAGSGTREVGDLLERNHLVRSGLAFALYARFHSGPLKIRSGRHTLYSDMGFEQILETLGQVDSQPDGIAVTIPEGYTLAQIAARLQSRRVTDAAAFVACARGDNSEVTAGIDVALPPGALEGYLYPDTYRFKSRTPATEVAHTMLMNFGARFARPYQREIASSGRTLHEIVTIASLVEREAKAPQDRARIAGVIVNRLRRKMRLEIDATVLYALGHHKQHVYFRDLKVDSPYNTYRRYGLPPGPIASPGLASLLAALRPEQHRFLYYVARPDGTHIFSRTPAEHEAAKQKARRERKAQSANRKRTTGE